jgi:hypothetical protein
MEVVKVQRKSTGMQVRVPNSLSHVLENVKYVTCVIDETGIHYSPIK